MTVRRIPIGVLAVVPVLAGMGIWAFTGQAQVEDPAVQATATANAAESLTPEPTATAEWWVDSPPQWTPAPAETPWAPPATAERRGDFRDGAWVRVNAGAGDCLNARNTASLTEQWSIVNICLPDGHEALITGEARQGDGHWWWHLAGLGYVAEEYLVFVGEFDVRANRLPDLAAKGKVAFLRGNDIWMMDADGSNQRMLVDVPEEGAGAYDQRPRDLSWSPDGTMLSYVINRYGDPDYSVDLHILAVADGTERVFERTAGGEWSPDSARMGIVRDFKQAGMSFAEYDGVPAILDVATGGQLILGSERIQQHKPPSFNYDGSQFMVTVSDWDDVTGTSTVAMIFYDAEGVERSRINFGPDEFYASPQWSSSANLVAAHMSADSEARYALFDVASGQIIGQAVPPVYSPKLGGRCGGGDMWKTAWSADGSHVLYSFQWGDTGANGIWAWDVASGEQRVVVAAGASEPSAGPGGAVMFSAGEHIFTGTTDGGLPRVLTDGTSPVWHFER